MISVISRQLLRRSARPTSISLKIGKMRVFSKKQASIFYSGQKASHKKKYTQNKNTKKEQIPVP
jgi:hypothetical protein